MNTETQESIQPAPPQPAPPISADGPTPEATPSQRSRPSRANQLRWLAWRLLGLILVGGAAFTVWRATTGQARPTPRPTPAPVVAVVKVTREDLAEKLVCDAEFRPYQEVNLHAKVAGYLQNITVDLGDRVKAGQLLASLEIPELADDLDRAQAVQKRNVEEVGRAQAAYKDAHLVYSRLLAVDKAQPHLIAQQELDAAQAKDLVGASTLAATRAEVEVSRAEINRLQTMLHYTQITAPFSGVITERYVDPGALIQAGTSSGAQTLPLVRLSQNDRLRLDIPVSVSYVSRIHLGEPVQVCVESLGKSFTGTIARTTEKVEMATRTMKVEVDVPNSDLRLIPGMYASVVLRLNQRAQALAVPVEAVSHEHTPTVLVVNKDDTLEERAVTLGLAMPHKVEVLTGLHENELVLIGNRTQVRPGQRVEPRLID
jgi:RND family efflux transporter MFP subunit